ncbi:Autoinducer binding domain-containing protein [Lutimaribacter pacificus]|uniref:Autoinducer binding domain-containing protein n=1 Tax=Lutimaribacter pacificus TaxID=391948 RepID=A0A1H0DY37_9RHOB|nr:LuxR family transcriptional regulator [Lutimaribacter pacificus]SDN75072.1 Autoinducer binding domain-containing protein [Lutimaribacter pacificus]SHK58699.1 Autoinducer binding domain-containing protein [Lutimaribacter pacificus]
MALKQHGLSGHLDPLDWFATAARAPDKSAAWDRLQRIFSQLGVDSAGVVHGMPLRLGAFPRNDEMMGCLVTQEWHNYYQTRTDLIADDILARHLFTSRKPKYVDLTDASTLPYKPVRKEERDMIRLVADHGMRQSFAVSFADGRTGRISILMINKLAGRPGNLKELVENHLGALHRAAQFFLEGLEVRGMADSDPPGRLGNRERDCLQWAATGRTTQEIADITGLCDDTVNEYFASAKRKLGASNRTQAVVRAITLGLIVP